MWIKTAVGFGSVTGRVNLAHVAALKHHAAASNEHVVEAVMVDGTSYYVSDVFATQAEAVAAIDDLLLNGS